MRAHETLCHLGLIFSPSITAAAEAFMCCGGQRRNAGQKALRAPTEGKLQGAPSHRDPGEKASGRFGVYGRGLLGLTLF